MTAATAIIAAAGIFDGPPLKGEAPLPPTYPTFIDPNGPHEAMLLGSKLAVSVQPFGPVHPRARVTEVTVDVGRGRDPGMAS